jgi:putative transposase
MFLTWRLHGSLPAPSPLSLVNPGDGRAFVAMDRRLDAAAYGPVWLKDPRLAQLVIDCLQFGEAKLQLYRLRAWVVMANHVHVILFPDAPLQRITKAIKGYSGHQANQILGRTGQRFWQHESYDHWARDRDELERIVRYTEANPVRAGLVASEEQWPWSSAAIPRRGT